MTHNAAEVMDLVLKAVTKVNELLPPDRQIPTAPETVLVGAGGHLDSMDTVNLIVALDAELTRRFGAALSITEDMTLFGDTHPLASIASLAAYLAEELEHTRGRDA